jgi:hypothetical protein
LPAFAGSEDQVAVGAMCPGAEFGPSNFTLASQRLEIQISATGVGAGLPSGGPRNRPAPNYEKPKQLRCVNVGAAAAVSLPARSLNSCCGWLRTQGGEVFDLVRSDFNWCPQRDSNPRCRLESARPGIFRELLRSLVIG